MDEDKKIGGGISLRKSCDRRHLPQGKSGILESKSRSLKVWALAQVKVLSNWPCHCFYLCSVASFIKLRGLLLDCKFRSPTCHLNGHSESRESACADVI